MTEHAAIIGGFLWLLCDISLRVNPYAHRELPLAETCPDRRARRFLLIVLQLKRTQQTVSHDNNPKYITGILGQLVADRYRPDFSCRTKFGARPQIVHVESPEFHEFYLKTTMRGVDSCVSDDKSDNGSLGDSLGNELTIL